MSPVSRRRKSKKQSVRRPVPLLPVDQEAECGCPLCSDTGSGSDPQQLVGALLDSASDLVQTQDPLDAELVGASLLSLLPAGSEEFDEAFASGLVPAVEAAGTTEALALLVAIGSVAPVRVSEAAAAAADRLAETGVAQPVWGAEVGAQVTAEDCLRMSGPDGAESVLVCSFHRAERSHAVIITVDPLDCGAAREIFLLDPVSLPDSLEILRASARQAGLEITEEKLDPAEFRRQVETALDARAVHDSEELDDDLDEEPADQDGPPYRVLAALMRNRLRALPVSDRPAAAHPVTDNRIALEGLPQLFGNNRGLLARQDLAETQELPAKRKKADGAAPIYQLKVGLRGAKPPIWRRLEVPADIRLDYLHATLQIAFDWDDSHLHVFDTPYGRFGRADAGLEHQAEERVTLEQVAPEAKAKLRYTYDFGDDWEHDIVVEKILARDEKVGYPRCSGGRRSAPPEDCGGVWGYEYLLEALSNPDHPEHEERMDWMGLESVDDLPVDKFDADAVTRALSVLN